jgi:dienelactone hydrolase
MPTTRLPALLALLALAALVAACGGSSDDRGGAAAAAEPPAATTTLPTAPENEWAADVVRPAGPDGDWATLFLPRDRPPGAIVIFLHGWTDLDPIAYRPWIEHLVARGDVVAFVDYQESLLASPDAMRRGAERGIRAGLAEARARGADGPVVALGYSLGGALAVQYAASAERWGVESPRVVYGVFPAAILTDAALPPLPTDTEVVLVVGDRDIVVGRGGAEDLSERIAPHPVEVIALTSTAGRDFGHLAPRDDAPYIRETIWGPFDRLVDAAR